MSSTSSPVFSYSVYIVDIHWKCQSGGKSILLMVWTGRLGILILVEEEEERRYRLLRGNPTPSSPFYSAGFRNRFSKSLNSNRQFVSGRLKN